MRSRYLLTFALLALLHTVGSTAEVLVEAESFEQHGGWQLDTQFITEMGSPYLLAHGLGRPVEDATTEFKMDEAGEYTVWVRTYDWVARWDATGSPGRFKIRIGNQELANDLGIAGKDWSWHRAGQVKLTAGTHSMQLQDLTGFDGRCDSIYLTTDATQEPDNSSEMLSPFRRRLLGIEHPVEIKQGYDLVVVGGGYSGMGAAISAARMGCKVALIQDRGVLGGNGSSEVRVWAMGHIRRGKYPRIGEIIEEFADSATKSPGRAEEFGDAHKEEVVRSEKNIDLFLNHHAFRLSKEGDAIESVDAIDTRTNAVRRFEGALFADCTGHGTLGYLAEADWNMTPGGRMGMSNMWTWDEVGAETSFPETPWALPLNMADFPYPRDHHGQWFWESGFDQDPLGDAEGIRDWNLRAVYGAFNAMKNGDGAAEHRDAVLTWIAYIGGPRESRRLTGDVVLTQQDIVNKREFPDGCVPSTWSIDLHYPKEQYAQKFPDNPFISIAEHDRRIDRQYGYPVPYRCFYSRSIPNLFMAGRCISVTHEALGTTRVMKTCGMMGEVVGKAASLCTQHECQPRDVYQDHLSELIQLLELPGKAFRETVTSPITVPDDALPKAGPYGPETLGTASLPGVVVDDRQADLKGKWTEGDGLKGFVGSGYRYASANSGAQAVFTLKATEAGQFQVRISWLPHENRGDHVSVSVLQATQAPLATTVNMRKPAAEDGFAKLTTLELKKGDVVKVVIDSADAGGTVHIDAAQLLPVKK
ncbi:FAD-dependent oxidoreductase [Aureliella helgolandensis]